MAERRDVIIAADFGTSGVKVGLLDRDLSILAEAFADYPVNYLPNDAVEQNPMDWWMSFRRALADLRLRFPAEINRAAALVLSAQMCGVTATAEDGTPLRPCMIWLDKRSAALIRRRMWGFPSVIGYGARKLLSSVWIANGAPSLNGMDPPGKMLWLQRNEPAIWAKTHKLLDVKDWLLHRLTGKFVTTADCANLTWMMNSRRGETQWSQSLAQRFGVTVDKLPEIIPGTASPGGLTKAAAEALGLSEGLPVVAGSGDVGAAALGSGAIEDGALHICLGTSSWIGGFYPSRRLSPREAYATVTSSIDNRPLLIATQESAGACLDWYSSINGAPDQTLRNAPTEEPLPLFLPWMAGERVPVDDNRLRGAFLGLTFRHDRTSMAQSVVEGVVLNIRWAYQSVKEQSGTLRYQRLPVVGGAAQDEELVQALSDCLNAPLVVGPLPRMAGMQGTAAIAAAYLGWYSNAWAAATCLARSEARIYSPSPERARYFDKRFDLFTDAHLRLKPWMHGLHDSSIAAA